MESRSKKSGHQSQRSSEKSGHQSQRPNERSGHQSQRPNVNLNLNHKSRPAASPQGGVSGSGNRPCREHSFLTDVADVRQMEQGLLQLLNDFHSGKLQAFGNDSAFEKMDQVREQQEKLAKIHFDMDSERERDNKNLDSRDESDTSMGKLMDNLHELCTSIQSLHKGEQPQPPQASH